MSMGKCSAGATRVDRPLANSLWVAVASCFIWFATAQAQPDRQVDCRSTSMARIPAGTILGQENANGWNRVVLLAKPRLASGAVDQIPAIARRYATRFNVVIMARVSAVKGEEGQLFQLERVGVGYCTQQGDRQVVISSETSEQQGVELDTVERIVLQQNEKVLDEMVQLVRSRTICLFDVKALVLAGGRHHDMLIRHLVWVTPATGKVAALVWPLVPAADGPHRLAGKSLSVVPEGFQEDRLIHVSEEEITLGIPSSRAFALARMPPGKNLAADEPLAQLAARRRYDEQSIQQLLDAVREAF